MVRVEVQIGIARFSFMNCINCINFCRKSVRRG